MRAARTLKPPRNTWRTKDLTGQVFGYLTVLSAAGSDGRKLWWNVRCSCGAVVQKVGAELQKGRTKSCGCRKIEMIRAAHLTHGNTQHPLYGVWASMRARCGRHSHPAYHNYGARGIVVCERWQSFENFWADMHPAWRSGLTLERLDNDGGYSPENCAWRDRKHQARNTRRSVQIDTPEGRMTVDDAAALTGISRSTLEYRRVKGWPVERMFDKPDVRNRCTTS